MTRLSRLPSGLALARELRAPVAPDGETFTKVCGWPPTSIDVRDLQTRFRLQADGQVRPRGVGGCRYRTLVGRQCDLAVSGLM